VLALCEREEEEEEEKGEKEEEEARRAGSTSKFFREARGQRRRKKEEESAGRTRRGRGDQEEKERVGIRREERRKARRRGDVPEAPDRKEVMRSVRRKRKREERERASKRGKRSERKGGEKPRRSLRGPETTASKKRAKRKRGNPTRALPLPYLALPTSPHHSSSSSLPRLACACQLATRRQTRPSLSFVLMPTRLHASAVFLVVVFLFTLANLNPPVLPSTASSLGRFGLVFRCRALAREPFRLSRCSSSHPNARANAAATI